MQLKKQADIISVSTINWLIFGMLLIILSSCTTAVFADGDSITDVITIDVPSSCSFSAGGGNYATTMQPNSTSTITANNITVVCNDHAGYAIYAIGFSGDSYYGDNTDLISSLDSDYNIKTDGSGAFGSSWKMKITAVTNATVEGNYGSFQNIPTTYAKVASYNSNTTGGTITPSYQINISSTQVADTYVGAVKYTLVHPSTELAPTIPQPDPSVCPANTICYFPNSDDTDGDMSVLGTNSDVTAASAIAGIQSTISGASSTTITSSTTEIELIAPNFARAGYGFAGWSTSYEASDNSKIYGPNETITITAGDLTPYGMILFPVWVASSGNMQGWTGCASLTAATYNGETGKLSLSLSSLRALTDVRDGNVYTVAKLADGNCWMLENLRLSSEHTTSSTDIANAQGYAQSATFGDFIGLASSENANFTSSLTPEANDYYSTSDSTEVNIGSSENPGYRMPRYNNNNTNMTSTSLTDSPSSNDNHSRWYSYGNYYTWHAAMANTKYYSTYYNSDNTENKNSDAAGTSLCPTGWQLPLGAASSGDVAQGAGITANRVGGFSYLNRIMGGNGTNQTGTAGTAQSRKWRAFPNNIVYSGNYKSAAATSRGTLSELWTRSASGKTNSFQFSLEAEKTNPGAAAVAKYQGRAIRCIKQ